MPEVHINGKAIKTKHMLQYLGIVFDRSLSGRDNISKIIQISRKGLIALKTMASFYIPQRILRILFNTLFVSITEYGLGLLTL